MYFYRMQPYVKSLKQQQPLENYDAIIIGSGLGGMTTARLLQENGYKKIVILEQHYTAGGYTHFFSRKDYSWDVGVHYVGEVGDQHSGMSKMLRYIGDGTLAWSDMGEVYDKIVFGETEYDYVKGKDAFTAKMKTYFPASEDQKAIDKYMKDVYQAARSIGKGLAPRVMPGIIGKLFTLIAGGEYKKYAGISTRKYLNSITSNEKLIGVLTGQYGDYGLPPGRSSFLMHATLTKHYMKGGHYPIGGSGRIADSILGKFAEKGGEVFINATVEQILTEGNKVVGVKLSNGKVIQSPLVVSNAGVHITYGKLLKANQRTKNASEHFKKLPRSGAHISLYIGLAQTAEELGLPKHNYWVYPDEYNHDVNYEKYLQIGRAHV